MASLDTGSTSSTTGPGRRVLDTAMALLHALPGSDLPGQITHLSRATGIPYPTVHRVLGQLTELGMVTRSDGRYRLGYQLLDLAGAVEPIAGLRQAAAAVMAALRDHTGATVSLVTVMDEHAVILDLARGREGLPYPVVSGHRMRPGGAAALLLKEPIGRARHMVIDDGDDLPGLTCCAVTIPLPGDARAAVQLSSSARRPAAGFAAAVEKAADSIGAAMRARQSALLD